MIQRSCDILKSAFPVTLKTTTWLLKIMIPISLAVNLLQHYGVIAWLATYLDPVFVHLGLPGYSAIAYLTGAAVSTYASVAVMLSMPLTLRAATIISIMVGISHALFVESAVVRKTGSSFWGMFSLRVIFAFICGWYLNLVLPEMNQPFTEMVKLEVGRPLTEVLQSWAVANVKMSVMIFLLIYALMVIQRVMDAFNLTYRISRILSPLMRLFGLPDNASYMWVVGNVLGISYGSAVMIDLEERGQISREEANDVNYHLVMNHSMLEDTLVFASFGVSAWWILSTRMLFAMILVWGRKLLCRISAL